MSRRLTIDADHRSLRRLRPWLEQFSDIEPQTLGRVELCLHELVANVIDHASATTVTIEASRTPEGLTVRLDDDGTPACLAVSLAAHPRIGGYGLLIADQLAAELDYARIDDHNVWVAHFDAYPPTASGDS